MRVFCDDWEQASHNGDLPHAVEAGAIARGDVTQLGDVLAGTARRPPRATTRSRCSTRPASRSRTGDRARRLERADRARPADDRPLGSSAQQQSRRVEALEQRLRVAEHRARHEVAAHEAEDVPVARVAAGDPRAVVVRNAADDGQEVEHETEDARPSGARPSTGRPTSSATNDSSALWIVGVVSSSAVNSESSAKSRKPPARIRPSGVCCQ